MIYQTKMTREVLDQIEKASRVKWNGGQLPTEYWGGEDDETYLNVSEDGFLEGCGILVEPARLYCGRLREDRILCTAEEFVGHCKRMKPRD
jgi:hypothetical protein